MISVNDPTNIFYLVSRIYAMTSYLATFLKFSFLFEPISMFPLSIFSNPGVKFSILTLQCVCALHVLIIHSSRDNDLPTKNVQSSLSNRFLHCPINDTASFGSTHPPFSFTNDARHYCKTFQLLFKKDVLSLSLGVSFAFLEVWDVETEVQGIMKIFKQADLNCSILKCSFFMVKVVVSIQTRSETNTLFSNLKSLSFMDYFSTL